MVFLIAVLMVMMSIMVMACGGKATGESASFLPTYTSHPTYTPTPFAKLSGANLVGANLESADLSEANLEGANLYRANLEGAKLAEANLAGANLAGFDLSGADLTGADLSGATLTEANLTGVDLSVALNVSDKALEEQQRQRDADKD